MFKIGKVRNIFVSLGLVSLVLFANNAFAMVTEYQPDQELDEEKQSNFVAGQVWSYVTREQEPKSKLTVLKVDYFEEAVVVHIRLENIKLKVPNVPNSVKSTVSHMAIMQTALQKSVIKLLDKNRRLPEFSKEYEQWREGDGVGTAWAWHFTVSESLTGLEKLYINEQQSSAIENRQKNNN